jgi:hypothetical protein
LIDAQLVLTDFCLESYLSKQCLCQQQKEDVCGFKFHFFKFLRS